MQTPTVLLSNSNQKSCTALSTCRTGIKWWNTVFMDKNMAGKWPKTGRQTDKIATLPPIKTSKFFFLVKLPGFHPDASNGKM